MKTSNANYLERRSEIETYFDRTAAKAWEVLTSNAPVGRIRTTVRQGRDQMRHTLLSWLPQDMQGMQMSADQLQQMLIGVAARADLGRGGHFGPDRQERLGHWTKSQPGRRA